MEKQKYPELFGNCIDCLGCNRLEDINFKGKYRCPNHISYEEEDDGELMEEYKILYNRLLERYYNGCKYLKDNPNEYDKYIKIILNFQDKLGEMCIKYNIVGNNILNGFNS